MLEFYGKKGCALLSPKAFTILLQFSTLYIKRSVAVLLLSPLSAKRKVVFNVLTEKFEFAY